MLTIAVSDKQICDIKKLRFKSDIRPYLLMIWLNSSEIRSRGSCPKYYKEVTNSIMENEAE